MLSLILGHTIFLTLVCIPSLFSQIPSFSLWGPLLPKNKKPLFPVCSSQLTVLFFPPLPKDTISSSSMLRISSTCLRLKSSNFKCPGQMVPWSFYVQLSACQITDNFIHSFIQQICVACHLGARNGLIIGWKLSMNRWSPCPHKPLLFNNPVLK